MAGRDDRCHLEAYARNVQKLGDYDLIEAYPNSEKVGGHGMCTGNVHKKKKTRSVEPTLTQAPRD